jgi:hypothetical protein
MNNAILFTICMTLPLFVGSIGVSSFAQNASQVNETGEAAGNVTKGLGGALNKTGEPLSNITGNIAEGIKDVVNGSGQ